MGIYREHSKTHEVVIDTEGRKRWTETQSEPGLSWTRTVTAEPWVETRTNCFCCTCDETDWGSSISDPACRNHGFAAKRPCDIHNMPGTPWEDFGPNEDGTPDPLAGTMPESVLTIRKRNGNDHFEN